MYLIVGLGNPEEKYGNTRHNMGFDVINKLSKKYNIDLDKKNFKGIMGMGVIEGEKVILLKPQTYMNLSGESVRPCLDFYKIAQDNLIIIYDDCDIPAGTIRIRKNGSAGSHNGMKSVIQMLGTKEFIRIRIGIGSPKEHLDLTDHVIQKLSKEEYKELEVGIDKSLETIFTIIKDGIDKAMNMFN